MDVRQVVTDRIIAILEKGGSVFRERWTRAAARGVPRNGKTGAPDRGANVLLLWDAAMEEGYASNVWLTYRQAQSLGAQVLKGERGVLCAHFERRARERRGDADDVLSQGGTDEEAMTAGAGARAGVLLCLPFWLFNVAQIDGLPLEVMDLGVVAPAASVQAPVERAVRLLGGCNATRSATASTGRRTCRRSTRSGCRGRGSSRAPRRSERRRCTSWCIGPGIPTGRTGASGNDSAMRPMPSRNWWPSWAVRS
ncbi:ArdC-like ssDNA-binding domain-containing protein [Variovorax sp. OK605]|uniref:ArdC-like ssDNA-binding domain-containing protein n=1 Tax=Variovorax sp. OK605 TaxID=1855317 RepID=UPI00210E22C7|nr:ArdC family protein [Variovorax sp. OK605]